MKRYNLEVAQKGFFTIKDMWVNDKGDWVKYEDCLDFTKEELFRIEEVVENMRKSLDEHIAENLCKRNKEGKPISLATSIAIDQHKTLESILNKLRSYNG